MHCVCGFLFACSDINDLFKFNVLFRTLDSATGVVDELMHYKWIDGLTRAVFVEFLLYNPNVNLYAISMLNFEFSETGGT